MTALLFVLAWATSGINGWFYVGNYGVPWFDKQPVIVGFPVTTIFLVLAIACGLLAGWLHFRMDYAGHTEVADTGRNRALASTPLLVVAVIMVVLELGSLAKGAASRYPAYTTAQGQRRGAGLGSVGRPAARWPTTCSSSRTPTPVCCNRFRVNASVEYGPLGGEDPGRASPRTASATPSSRPSPSRPTPAP